MELYTGTDVSLELSSICVLGGMGKIRWEFKVSSELDALVQVYKQLEPVLAKIVARRLPCADSG